MADKVNSSRIVVVLLFAITFTVVGWFAPMVYAANVPQNNVIEVHSFSAENTTINAEQHRLYLDRTVHQPAAGQKYTQLYMVDEDGDRIAVDHRKVDHYFAQGRTQIISQEPLPEELSEGKYRYVLVVKMDMADGRVERTFSFKSEPFYVTNTSAS